MYVYVCLFIVDNFSRLGEAKILAYLALSPALALVCIRNFLLRTSATCSRFSICRPKDQSVQSAKCAPGSIVALFSNICLIEECYREETQC